MRLRLVVASLLIAMACTNGAPEAGGGDEQGLRIASFDFLESEVLAELYAQASEAAGVPVVRLGAVGPREVVRPALAGAQIDLVPEYAGTALRFSSETSAVPVAVEAVVERLNDAVEPLGLVALEPAPAIDVNVFVVSSATAQRLGLEDVSDLAGAGLEVIGGPAECPERPLCLLGLNGTYGVRFAEFVAQPSLLFTAEALRRGEIDVGVLFSTSPELDAGDLVALRDDRSLQPADNVVPLLRRDALERWGDALAEALNAVSAALETEDLRALNRGVAGGEPVEAVAARWLAESLSSDDSPGG